MGKYVEYHSYSHQGENKTIKIIRQTNYQEMLWQSGAVRLFFEDNRARSSPYLCVFYARICVLELVIAHKKLLGLGTVDWLQCNSGSRVWRIHLEWKGVLRSRFNAKLDKNCVRSEADRTPDGVKLRFESADVPNCLGIGFGMCHNKALTRLWRYECDLNVVAWVSLVSEIFHTHTRMEKCFLPACGDKLYSNWFIHWLWNTPLMDYAM